MGGMVLYKRILIKLSGETLAPADLGKIQKNMSPCFEEGRILETARMLLEVSASCQVGVVIGGGNIWRGRFSDRMDPVNADQIGMLATVLNALAVQDAIISLGGRARVFTAQEMNRFADLYTAARAGEAMDRGEIVLLAGGSGNPFFSTDTAAALRCAELHCDALFKGTDVDGVYPADPRKNPGLQVIPELTYDEAIDRRLGVMDLTAFEICKSRKVPFIRVFNMKDLSNVAAVARGEAMGTVLHP